jgi:hypothetical protein
MDIPPFSSLIGIKDFEQLMRVRLSQQVFPFREQACRLVSYMVYPNDVEERSRLLETARNWPNVTDTGPLDFGQVQVGWGRVADIFNVHHDLTEGGHQKRRGGASIGKAKAVISKTRLTRGRSEAIQSESWARYKDVAHLAAAAVFVSGDAQERMKRKPFGEFALPALQLLQPFVLTMLLPDLVLAAGFYLQDYGLRQVPHSRDEPMLDPESLWRIPEGINISPVPPPIRGFDEAGRAALRERRAGNRGKEK